MKENPTFQWQGQQFSPYIAGRPLQGGCGSAPPVFSFRGPDGEQTDLDDTVLRKRIKRLPEIDHGRKAALEN